MASSRSASEKALFRLLADIGSRLISMRDEIRDDLTDLTRKHDELTARFSETWLSIGDAAAFLGLPERWLLKECRRGKIPYYCLGRDRRFKVGDLVLYSQSLPFRTFLPF